MIDNHSFDYTSNIWVSKQDSLMNLEPKNIFRKLFIYSGRARLLKASQKVYTNLMKLLIYTNIKGEFWPKL